jgi:hypothetical protein
MVVIEWSYDTWGFCKNTIQSEDIEGINLWDITKHENNSQALGFSFFCKWDPGISDDHQDFEPLSMGYTCYVCSSTVVQIIATTRYIAVGVAGNSFRNISLNHHGTEPVSFFLGLLYGMFVPTGSRCG